MGPNFFPNSTSTIFRRSERLDSCFSTTSMGRTLPRELSFSPCLDTTTCMELMRNGEGLFPLSSLLLSAGSRPNLAGFCKLEGGEFHSFDATGNTKAQIEAIEARLDYLWAIPSCLAISLFRILPERC